MGLSIHSPFGIEIAFNILRKTKTNIADKAKPRVIVGRKATGPDFSGLPGCRSKRNFSGPVVYIEAGLFFRSSVSTYLRYWSRLSGRKFIGKRIGKDINTD